MTNNRFLRRRTLRSSMSLVEGAVWCRSDPDTVMVEVFGGPPSCPIEVAVAGRRRQLDLDARGCGSIRFRAPAAAEVVIRHEGTIILDGTTPASPTSRRRHAESGQDR